MVPTSNRWIIYLLMLLGLHYGCTSQRPLHEKSSIWTSADQSKVLQDTTIHLAAGSYHFWQLKQDALEKLLSQANDTSIQEKPVIWLPLPNGQLIRFTFSRTIIMEPALANKFPGIQTFTGQGIDQPAATAHFDYTLNGFKAIILAPEGTIYIEPFEKKNTACYISYFKSGILPNTRNPFELQAPIKE